jgi:hypothetical protein
MKTERQIGVGTIAGVVLATVFELVPDHGISALIGMAIVALVGLAVGQRLPMLVRVMFTVLIFYFGATMALVGRTMEPGLTRYTFGWALNCFAIVALLPSLALLRLWDGRLRVALVVAVLPVSMTLAFAVAGIEEAAFIQKHKETGIGPTARWTVSNHWLSYNAKTGKLDGSD